MCRCTGYRPIADAFKSFATDADQRLLDKICDLEDLSILKQCGVKCAKQCPHKNANKVEDEDDFTFLNDNKMIKVNYGTQRTWYRAYSLDDVFKAMANGEYKLIAGNTGQDIFNVAEIKGYIMDVNVVLGAGMPLSEMMQVFQDLSAEKEEFEYLKQLYDHMDLVAHIPVRNIMPRSQNAHAVVNAGFLFKFEQNSNLLEKATIVYGSISPKFIHASKTEQVLFGKDPFNNETLQLALKTLSEEVSPEEAPPEPSAKYRKMLAIALYYKAILSLSPDDKVDPRFRSGGEAIKRHTSKGSQTYDTDKTVWPLNQPVPKIEALVQCSGEATFANDLPTQTDEVFAAFVTADAPPGSIINDFDLSEAMKISGVIAFYSAKDIPGENTFTPAGIPFIVVNEELLCEKEVQFYGQPAGLIVADKEKTANKAAKLVKVKYSSESKNKPLLTIDEVMASPERSKRVKNDKTVEPTDTGHDVKTIVYGDMKIGSQFHYYMEPQTSVARLTEDGMEVYSSTQWLDLNNVAVANVNIIVRRVGGAYGGKISRSAQIACAAALVTHLLGKTCRLIMPLTTNMKTIGKRIGTNCSFEIGVDKEGVIQYLKNDIYQDAGCSYNEALSALILKPFQNCYDAKRWQIKTSKLIMEKIAYCTGQDPIEVRLRNMLQEEGGEKNPIPEMIEQIKKDSEFSSRKEQIDHFNTQNRYKTTTNNSNFNSIVNIYHGDGTVVVIHGGIEMGQGINTKTAQVCAYALGIPLDKISVKPSTSFTSPNAIVTGGSIGSECVSFATMKACEILNERLKPFKEKLDNPKWEEVIGAAYAAGIDLQATYMFSPAKGDVQAYNVYAVGVIEVELDILSGNHDVRRVDILEDTGRSLSPEIDVAQIEGAFIMGLGYWTSEKLNLNNQKMKN
ncbi:Aldehyde oxidase AOX1 [Operophtera brumata]|uniref:Aldehyde oxidase AOX1 n=1 Tax=Operophtera brumata TaxID=104452 RepID=A0A0L7LLP8_OPEBR|nr:Aldehyde oxidase AOX1 [Operophtera brumata]